MRTHTHTTRLALVGLAAFALLACESAGRSNQQRVIVVPTTATTAPAYETDGSVRRQRYVVRMSDGKRDWEIEFPDTARGYRLDIPMTSKPGSGIDVAGDDLTAADKEMLEALRRNNGGIEREGILEDGVNAADPPLDGPGSELPPVPGEEPEKAGKGKDGVDPFSRAEDTPAPSRRSYFLGIEKVKRLYRAGRYEFAIVHMKELDKDYPNDPQILSMMGTLYLKVGQPDLARRYWMRVLEIDRNNKSVIEALKQLNRRQGGAAEPDPNATP